ncbi:MAG: hypothetical protein C5B50_26745 [Verrucomicrobia bacterium]|nr:MAG: hypothetical protein C5B50_26745 [Verrucomicrobiota bacterium]
MYKRYFLFGTFVGILAGSVGCKTATVKPPATHAETGAEPVLQTRPDEEKVAQGHAHYAAGVIAEIQGDESAALEEYYKAALADPENESLTLDVSRRFIQRKQPEKALELLKSAAAQPKASGLILARLGLTYAQLGKTEQAIAADRAAIKRSPEALAGYQNLFVTLVQAKQEVEALKVLDEAGRQPHADAEFLLGLAELYENFSVQSPGQKEKMKERQLQVLRRADQLNPPEPTLRLRLADSLNLLGDWQKAARIYEKLLNSLGELPLHREGVRAMIHAKLADIYRLHDNPKRAREEIEALIHEDKTNPQAYYWLGQFALDEGKPGEAAEHFSKTILLRPDLEPAYYDLAISLIETNQPARALETLEKARKRFAQNFVLEFLTGMAFGAQKAYGQAIEHYTAAEVVAKATDPKRLDYKFYYQFGAACERKGDYEQAATYFEKSLQLKPDYAEALNYLGYMWAEHGVKLDKARTMIEKAVKLEPKNPAYLDSLGWVLYKLNQPKEALANLLKAVQLSDSPDPTIFDHLGDIYAALKEPDKAHEAWRKSLSLEPNDEVKKKVDGK